MLRFDAGRGGVHVRQRRNWKGAVESRERAAGAVWNRDIKAVAETALAELPESSAVAEDLVSHDHQHVILWHVEREKLSRSIKDAHRQRRPASFGPQPGRQPPILGGRT